MFSANQDKNILDMRKEHTGAVNKCLKNFAQIIDKPH